jgi:ABC-type Mn2+/Zn2+ transport system permease subunit
MNWWDDAVHRAIAEVVLAGALAAIVGVHVVLRRLSFFTMALTHATFPGVVAATLIGVDVLAGGFAAGAAIAVGVAALSRRTGQNAAAATGVLLSAGFALGASIIATQSGFSRDLSALLVGSILTVTTHDLLATAAILMAVAGVLLACARPLLYTGFDPTGASAAGYHTAAWDLALLLTIELVVVALVPAVGTILAVALIVAPAAAARQWTARPPTLAAFAAGLAIASGLGGLYLSNRCNIAAGAAITLTATAALLASTLLHRATVLARHRPGSMHRATP